MRNKLIDLIIDAKRTDPENTSFTEHLADHLIANGVTFATDIKVGHWIIHNQAGGRKARTQSWAECSECHVCGSPQWKVCPVCEAKMDGDGNG